MITYKVIMDRPRQDGQRQLRIRLTYRRQTRLIATGFFIDEKDFNSKATIGTSNWVKGTHRQSSVFNNGIANLLTTIISRTQSAAMTGQFNWEMISDAKPKQEPMFLEFFRKFVDTKPGAQNAWIRKYNSIYNKVSACMQGTDIPLTKVNYEFIQIFKNYLIKIGNQGTTIHRNLSFLRTVLYEAEKYKLLNPVDNPFFRVRLNKPKVTKHRLSPEDMGKFAAYYSENQNRRWSAKIFAFQFYAAGMRIGDALLLRNENLDFKTLEYDMQKTGKVNIITLPGIARLIIDEVQRGLPGDQLQPHSFVFPFMQGMEFADEESIRRRKESRIAEINQQLKIIAKELGVEEKVTTHIARHSFADFARKKSGDVYAVSKALGHANIGITENYMAGFDQNTVDGLLGDMFDHKPDSDV